MTDSSATRIMHLLKTRGPQTAAVIARHLSMTSVGARKHLATLLDRELVIYEDEAGAVGRPKRVWGLSQSGHAFFPDTHDFLTLELISAARRVFGEAGVDRLIADRENETLKRYTTATQDTPALQDKLKILAQLRSEEGYMAEIESQKDGSYLLIENHCPICAAASECQGFCRSELQVFATTLGPDCTVERTDHILAGARRCAYRIAPKASS